MPNDTEPGGRPGGPEPDDLALDLLREAFDETRQLVALEVALAREELRAELTGAKRGGTALGLAAGLALGAATMLLVSIAAMFSKMWIAALVMSVTLVVSSAALALLGWGRVPKNPLVETRKRLEADLTQFKERART